ncbi:extracellular solute-binding protein [Sphaerimonospora thailandensis]|uniref:ABC transporter substrate-binding protein n=1 Tax=Sphaerimonospora thailandensis TaxID=795644 RepID=A0A8J3VXD6_9ACTN|nr:extracellular solute-binding protein [Sphaerimonospora thailandensis]GIH67790.1 ABC transporter substrate-binding protein [Sphaerimonospora thailandensis]
MTEHRTVVDVWLAEHPFASFLDPMRKAAEEFGRAHPGHRVRIRAVDFREMPGEVARAAERGEPPAVAEYYATAARIALDTRARDGRPLFTSIEAAIGGRADILGEPVAIDRIEAAARGHYAYGGELVSVPVTATTALLFANATMLREAGVPRVPETWHEVEAACRAIARLPHGPSAAITWPDHGWLFQQAVASQGGLLADHDNGRSGRASTVDLSSAQMAAYVEWWRRLHRDGHYLYTGTRGDWGAAFDAFATGRVAFTVGSSIIAGAAVRAGREAGFDVEVARLPRNGDVPYAGNLVSGQSFWLADGLDEATRDGALAFIQFLLRPEVAAAWHKSAGFIPITVDSFDLLAKAGWFDEHPWLRVATDQLRAADGSPAALGALLGDFAGIQDVMTQAMEDVLVRAADPAGRFTRATADAQRLLDEYNADCRGPAPRTPRRLEVG